MNLFFRQQPKCCLWLASTLVLILLGTGSPARTQVIPDATLPNDTLVIPNGNISIIEQGTRVGGNVFHSFLEFSVPTGGVALFNNAPDIQNILSRVRQIGLLSTIATIS